MNKETKQVLDRIYKEWKEGKHPELFYIPTEEDSEQ